MNYERQRKRAKTPGLMDVQAAVFSTLALEQHARDPATQAAVPPAVREAREFKTAFMADVMGPKALLEVPLYCQRNGVLILKRGAATGAANPAV
ncbi:hypothetical protein GPECTOR_431g304 [Gonium pectorale]|uniref:Uncharacterized protein n=1 Tax=Gonium pectorale TaxID=33097 RepID=A0A150FV67_GONPE|nr:hypothetical protein GPECTOR_431g304 [Gonium pectorale]|eukprot:KXZ41497.1 hypothetical protein GPECTOR_431g304 [Gonium pectorale]